MSSTTPRTKALCLLLVVMGMTIGAASAAKPLPGSCLMAASTLCSNADTNAMRCLRQLAIKGDARVPSACAAAIMAGVTMNPRLNQASRAQRMSRLLTEGGDCSANNCPSSFGRVQDNRCNDVLTGCSGCPHGTFTIVSAPQAVVVPWTATNPNGINCANICCKADNGAAACCQSYTSSSGLSTAVMCNASSHAACNLR